MRLGTYDCYTHESLSQIGIYGNFEFYQCNETSNFDIFSVLTLIDKFGLKPDENEIKIISYDVACGLAPFLEHRFVPV